MNAQILVTGATGTVGGALVGQLAEAGLAAGALVRRDVELPDGIEPVVGDLTDPASLDDALVGVDVNDPPCRGGDPRHDGVGADGVTERPDQEGPGSP